MPLRARLVPCRRASGMGLTLPLRKLPPDYSGGDGYICRIRVQRCRLDRRCANSLQIFSGREAPVLPKLRHISKLRIGPMARRTASLCHHDERSRRVYSGSAYLCRRADPLDAPGGRSATIPNNVGPQGQLLNRKTADLDMIEKEDI